jgi:hypothetical protein
LTHHSSQASPATAQQPQQAPWQLSQPLAQTSKLPPSNSLAQAQQQQALLLLVLLAQ